MDTKSIRIAVSSCLLGEAVRYDGSHKQHALIIDALCNSFTCVAICPEMGIGLGVPRDPIGVYIVKALPRALGIQNRNLDVTSRLVDYADKIAEQYMDLCGYVFKARSPSCGLRSTPQYSVNQQNFPQQNKKAAIESFGAGIYADQIHAIYTGMPMIEEQDLNTKLQIDCFINEVKKYASEK